MYSTGNNLLLYALALIIKVSHWERDMGMQVFFQIPWYHGHCVFTYKEQTYCFFWCKHWLSAREHSFTGIASSKCPSCANLYPGHFTLAGPVNITVSFQICISLSSEIQMGPVRHICWVLNSTICKDTRLIRCMAVVIPSYPHFLCNESRKRNPEKEWGIQG